MAVRSRRGSSSTYIRDAAVSVTPGATALTRMPSCANSTAMVRVIATTAALAVPYAMWNGAVFIPLIDEIDTIDPGFPCATISAATAWLMKKVVSRFWVNSARQSDRATRVDGIQVVGAAPPAMLTRP